MKIWISSQLIYLSNTDQTLWKLAKRKALFGKSYRLSLPPHTVSLHERKSGVFGQTDWSVLTVWCEQLMCVCEIAV